MKKIRWILVTVGLFSAAWMLVAPNIVRALGDPEVAGWVPFWMIPVSIIELVLWIVAMLWPGRVTVSMFSILAVAQFLVGVGVFPK